MISSERERQQPPPKVRPDKIKSMLENKRLALFNRYVNTKNTHTSTPQRKRREIKPLMINNEWDPNYMVTK